MKKKKEKNKIIWTSVGFKEHMAMNTHWEEQGMVNGERRFLLFCEKDPIEVFLLDVKNGSKMIIKSGARVPAWELANDILIKEEMGDSLQIGK
jgi:hypothetical protein